MKKFELSTASANFVFKGGFERITVPVTILSISEKENEYAPDPIVTIETSHGTFQYNQNAGNNYILIDSPDSDTEATLSGPMSERQLAKELAKHDKYLARIDKSFKKYNINSGFAKRIRDEYADLNTKTQHLETQS